MLERELELVGAGALGALLKRKAKHMPQPGTPCANCSTPLQGPYCHICGQTADNQHRSILHLAWEGIEGLTHLDGRLAKTLPPLLLHPGQLAKDHFEGRRQRHVPPFRLFLIALLIFMFVLEGLFHGGVEHTKPVASADGQVMRTVTIDKTNGEVLVNPGAPPKAAPSQPAQPGTVNVTIGKPSKPGFAALNIDGKDLSDDPKAVAAALGKAQDDKNDKVSGWLKPRLKRAIENKEFYIMVLFTWAHRLAILLLPILAGLLALVYIRRRTFFIYDHLIVSMQFLSFVFLISAVAWILPDPGRGWAVLIASIWVPINLFQTLRGAYGSRWYTAALKTVFLWGSTLTLFGVLMLGLMALALAQM